MAVRMLGAFNRLERRDISKYINKSNGTGGKRINLIYIYTDKT